MTTNTNAALAEDLQDTVSKALRRAWQLGQTYWQQADSEYTSQHRKADETQGKFDTLVEETRAALSTAAQPPAAPQEDLREDASYESMNLAVMVLSDCGHSSNYTPLLERVAGRIDRHVERLLTAQRADLTRRAQAEPAAPASQDAEDALVAALIECDRQTESMRIWDGMGYRYHPPQARQIHDTARAAIDAARGAQGESNG